MTGPLPRELDEPMLTAIVRQWLVVDWPVADPDIPVLLRRWGWHVTSERPGKSYRAELPVTLNRTDVSAISLDDELTTVTLWTTDVVTEPSEDQRRAFFDAFARQTRVISSVVGEPIVRRPGTKPQCTWDLPSGERLTLFASDGAVSLELLSPAMAEVERELARRPDAEEPW